MGFRNNSYATCWSIEPGKGNFTNVRLSVSRKDKDGNYVTDFSGYCTFFAQAHAKAAKLKERDRIKLLEVDVSNRFDKEKNKEFTSFKVFDFEAVESGGGNSNASHATDGNAYEGDNDIEEAPF